MKKAEFYLKKLLLCHLLFTILSFTILSFTIYYLPNDQLTNQLINHLTNQSPDSYRDNQLTNQLIFIISTPFFQTAFFTLWFPCYANISSMKNEPMMSFRNKFLRNIFYKFTFGL